MVVNAVSTEIVTLGAGGGSIMSIGRSGDVRVGPESAGAVPGPACYGLGGEQPTITDAALLAGILAPDRFAGGRMSLDVGLAHQAFSRLDTRLTLSERVRYAWMIGLDNVAEGVVDVTIRHGLDARDLTLLAFGAAGPMLLPAILDLLPLRRVVVPPHPGTFSALGLLSTDQVFSDSRTEQGVLDHEAAPRLAHLYADLESELVAAAGLPREHVSVVRSFDARLLGQSWETPFVPAPGGAITAATIDDMVAGFHAEYERRNGHRLEQFPVEGLTFRVEVVSATEKVAYPVLPARPAGMPPPVGGVGRIRHLYDDGDGVEAATYERSGLTPGDRIDGPAIVREPTSTTFVPPGRALDVGDRGELVIGGTT
jgi:N-methylhydantoinase A